MQVATNESKQTQLQTSKTIDTKYKKVYKSVIEISKKLEEIYKSPNAFSRIFNSETTLLREKLQRYCESLIFREPIDFAKKTEEILWRRGFYDIINIVKINKKNLKSNTEIETMYRLHLSSSYGFYNNLLLKFQFEFGSLIKLDNFLDFSLISYDKPMMPSLSNVDNVDLLKEVALRILHKFLICLGDLARYQIEYDSNSSTNLAYKYYKKSLIILPTNGMPLNQLGTLFGSENYGCDGAYYYLYCLCCAEPFPGSKENLRLLFSKNRNRYVKLMHEKKNLDRKKPTDIHISEQRKKEIKKFLVSFLYLIDSFLTNQFSENNSSKEANSSNNRQLSNGQLQELCQLCLQEFNSCMFYTRNVTRNDIHLSTEDDKLNFLSDDLVFKLTLIILMTIDLLKSKQRVASKNQESNIYFICAAFAILFFSHILNHTIIRFQESLLAMNSRKNKVTSSKENVNRSDESDNEDHDHDDDDIVNNDENDQGSIVEVNKKQSDSSSSSSNENSREKDKTSSKKIRLLYGLRRRKHNSDSDTNDEEDDENVSKLSRSSSSSSSSSSSFSTRRKTFVEDDDDETVVQSSEGSSNISGGGSRSKYRSKREGKRGTKSSNVAKFLERENLSETELNIHSNTSSDESDSSKTLNSIRNRSNPPEKDKPKTNKEIKPSKQELTLNEANKQSASANTEDSTTTVIDNFAFFQQNFQESNNSSSVNFREFSTQLFSSFASLLDSKSGPNSTIGSDFPSQTLIKPNITSSGHSYNQTTLFTHDEFVDNEIYKFVLNGANVGVPPGFEINSKEAEEIEELGKKIATFQIETDTELSVFNTDDNTDTSSNGSSRSSSDIEGNYGETTNKNIDENEKKKLKFSMELKNSKILIDILQSQALLPTIKVFCDWLLCNKKIIQSISNVSTNMWSKLVILLNCIPLEKYIANEAVCQNDYVRNLIRKSNETKSWNSQPLSEDIHLRSFTALKLEHISLKFDLNKLNILNIYDEHLLRLCYLRRFGYLIASLSKSQSTSNGFSFFEYNITKSAFEAPENLVFVTSTAENTKNENEDQVNQPANTALTMAETRETRKMQLMKQMAQLRLEAEISQLESNFKSDETHWTPYLVPDTFALCNHLKIIQDLSKTNKFILIIPICVIDKLDAIKKESKLAREAIRWLESQFKQGNRFLRAQNQNEKDATATTSQKDSILKKRDVDKWMLYQLIDCCRYFQNQTKSNHEHKMNKMVTLLINDKELALAEAKHKSCLTKAQENNIDIAEIKEFYDKYSRTTPKST